MTDTRYTVQFVDQVSDTAAIRLDVCGTVWTLSPDTDLSPPALQRAYAGSLLADGRPLTAAAYDNRLIRLELLLREGVTYDQAAAHVQALVKEVERPGNFLRWQPGTSNAVYFRTLRAELGRVVWNATQQRCTVLLPAEPFGYGPKVTLSNAVVNNDPAAGSNACFFDLAAANLLGDVETPLYLRFAAADVTSNGRRTSALAVRRRGTPANAPHVVQAEALTPLTGTTLQANNAVMSGAGSNAMRSTVVGAMATRLTGTHPAAAGVDVRGTYRVFVRVQKAVAGDGIQMQHEVSLGTPTVKGDTIATLPADTSLRWIDLGLLQYPLGVDPVTDGYSGALLAADGMTLHVMAGRVSGTGTIDIDCVLLIPADDRFALLKWPQDAGPVSFVADPAASQVYAIAAGGQVSATAPVELAGALPMVTPGQDTRVYFVLDVGTTSTGGDDKTKTTTITPYYWPRYLYVRGAV